MCVDDECNVTYGHDGDVTYLGDFLGSLAFAALSHAIAATAAATLVLPRRRYLSSTYRKRGTNTRS